MSNKSYRHGPRPALNTLIVVGFIASTLLILIIIAAAFT